MTLFMVFAPMKISECGEHEHVRVKEYAGLALAAGLLAGAATMAFWMQQEKQFQPLPAMMQQWMDKRQAIAVRPTVSGMFLKAVVAQRAGDAEQAAKAYRKALTFQPSEPRLLEDAFTTALYAGDMTDAEQLAQVLIEQEQAVTMDIFRLATGLSLAELVELSHFIRTGNWEESQATLHNTLKQVRKGSLQEIFCILMQAWVLHAQGETDAGRSLITTLKPRPEVAAFTHIHAALWFAATGDEQTALARFAKVSGPKTLLPQRLTELYAHYLLHVGKEKESNALLDRFWSKTTDLWWQDREMKDEIERRKAQVWVDSPGKAMAELLSGAAAIFEKQGHISTAKGFAQIAFSLNPDSHYIRLLLASLHEREGLYEEVKELFAPVATEKTSFGRRAQMELAKALSHLEEPKKALKELKAIAQQYPAHPAPWLHMADILRGEESFAKAAAHYEEALQRMGEVKPHFWPVFYMLGICYERSEQWQKAEPVFLKALELSPNNPEVMNYLGYSWLVQGKHIEKARKMIADAVKMRPYDGHIIDSMGWALFKIGEYAEAVQYMERAVELMPADSTINDHLGDIYWKLGRQREAYFQWERALQFYDGEGHKDALEAKLRYGYQEIPMLANDSPSMPKDKGLQQE